MQHLQGILARALQVPVSALKAGNLEPVRVAVVDSGIDASHPDLAGRVDTAIAFVADAEGKVTTTVVDPTGNNDPYGHGTAVGGIIARIAPNARLHDVRVLGGHVGPPDALLAGLEHAADAPVDMLNVSVALGTAYAHAMQPIADRAYRRGKVIVAATRNMPLEDEGFPAPS
jgi:subtilisin family serine protease